MDPATSERTQAYIDKLVELRSKKGMTPEQAKEILLNQYLYYGVMMVKMGDADGMVSGACHSTADTLRPCLQILKTKPGTKLVSAFFLMVVPNCEYGANGTFIFADSGLNQNPNPEELAAIAASSAESFKLLVEEEPIVGMLSHSGAEAGRRVPVRRCDRSERRRIQSPGQRCGRQGERSGIPGSGRRKYRIQAGSETCQGRSVRSYHTGYRKTGERPVPRMLRRGYRWCGCDHIRTVPGTVRTDF